MHKNLLLAFGITILFLGLAINPAIAVNPISSDNEEDCDICPKVSKPHLVRLKRLLNRVEILNNKLSVVSKLNPEVRDKYRDLSDRITTISEMNKILNPNNLFNFSFCFIITIIIGLYAVFIFAPFYYLHAFFYYMRLDLMAEIVYKITINIILKPISPLFAYWFIICAGGILPG